MHNENPMELLDTILEEARYIPTFTSNLTLNTLKKISNKEIQHTLRRALDKEIINDGGDYEHFNRSSNEKKEAKGNIEPQDPQPSSSKTQPLDEKERVESEDSGKNTPNEPKQKVEASSSSKNAAVTPKKSQSAKKDREKDNISEQMKQMRPAKSSFHFKPLAKEHDMEYEIKVDPTGKLFTSGEYEDFYDGTVDKFKKLKNLMKKRPETHSAMNITNIHKYHNRTEVSTIGLVYEHRRTKNGHYFFVLEDLTGKVNVLIRNDSENSDLVDLAEKSLNDQMLFVRGTYSPGKKRDKGIIFADTLSKIDIPTEWESKTSPLPLSMALISDSHIGSQEFEEKLWNRFIDLLNGRWGNKRQRELAGRIKYVVINGDLIDGIGVYPSQKEDLVISDIYDQYKRAQELLAEIPDYIKIIYSSGNHEPVRNAIPRPAVPQKYCQDLLDIGIDIVGNPCMIQTHQVESLVYHGDSLLDLNLEVPGLKNEKPARTMKELLVCRHLAPVFGNKTQIAPTEQDWMVINEIPQIFHTGHMHINDYDTHRGVHLVNSGCFQSQTSFMKSLGINPTPGILQIMDLDTLTPHTIDLNSKTP
jgi:DNA polymerase II small subunit